MHSYSYIVVWYTFSVTVVAISETFWDAIPPYLTAFSVAERATLPIEEVKRDQPCIQIIKSKKV